MVQVVGADSIANHVVISEVKVAGTPEWVELYNPTNQPFDIGGWTLDTKTWANDATIPAGEIIPAYGFYLIGDTGCGGDHEDAITLTDANACVQIQNAAGTTIDAVGWGDNCVAGSASWEGTAYPTDPGAGKSLQRRVNDTITENGYGPGWDSNDNSADFFIHNPNPQNSGADPLPPVPELSTLILLSIGLTTLAGYVLLTRRRN